MTLSFPKEDGGVQLQRHLLSLHFSLNVPTRCGVLNETIGANVHHTLYHAALVILVGLFPLEFLSLLRPLVF